MPFIVQIQRHTWVIAFTLTYLTGSYLFSLVSGQKSFIGYLVFVPVMLFILVWLDVTVQLPDWVLWMLSVDGLLHLLGVLIHPLPGAAGQDALYGAPIIDGFYYYDDLVHTIGFSALTYICWYTLCSFMPEKQKRVFWPLIIAWLAGMGLGTINEIMEFFVHFIPGTDPGGYWDTSIDMIVNALAGAGTLFVVWWKRADPLPGPSDHPSPKLGEGSRDSAGERVRRS